MKKNILVKFRASSECITITTYSRDLKHRGSFYIIRERLAEWLANGESSFIDRDCSDFLTIRKSNEGLLFFDFIWAETSPDSFGKYVCAKQSFFFRESDLQMIVDLGNFQGTMRYLCAEEGQVSPVYDVERGALAGILKDKRKKRAFVKFLRDNFRRYRPFRVAVFPDPWIGKDSFGFYEDTGGGHGICGGIVLSKRQTKYGDRYQYNMHT